MDISQEDGEKRKGCFRPLHPKTGSKGAAEIGRPVSVRGHKPPCRSWPDWKKAFRYGCVVSMATAVLGVVD